MHRPRYLRCLLLAPVLIGLVFAAAGCGGSEHELMIKKFFMASGAGDTVTLGNIATVSFDPGRDGGAFLALGHRWTRGEDLAALVLLLRRMMEEAGSIEGFFLGGHDAGAVDVEPSLESFSRRALALAGAAHPRRRGLSYFFPRPSAGSSRR